MVMKNEGEGTVYVSPWSARLDVLLLSARVWYLGALYKRGGSSGLDAGSVDHTKK